MLLAAWPLLRRSGQVLLEAAPEGIAPDEIAASLRSPAGVTDVHDLHVWEISSGFPALSAHVLVGRGEDCHAIRRELEAVLHERFGIDHTTLQVEHTPTACSTISPCGRHRTAKFWPTCSADDGARTGNFALEATRPRRSSDLRGLFFGWRNVRQGGTAMTKYKLEYIWLDGYEPGSEPPQQDEDRGVRGRADARGAAGLELRRQLDAAGRRPQLGLPAAAGRASSRTRRAPTACS